MPIPPNLSALLESLLGKSAVISDPDALSVYECDAFTIPKAKPHAVIFPSTTEQVAAAAKLLHELKIPLIPRGAATGLAGGIVAVTPAVQLSLARMNRVLEVDLRNRTALVEPGVANWALSQAITNSAYHFAPDPSSQRASTIGGNAATNAGGLHTLKYGVTVNHILGLEVVLEDGSIHTVGGPHGHTLGPDITGLLVGTEGTLGIITKIWCRLTPKPVAFRTAVALFDDPQQACHAVADIIGAGIIPAALEMLDHTMIGIVEDAFHLGLPKSAGALLLIEVDGQDISIKASGGGGAEGAVTQSSLDADLAEIQSFCQKHAATSFDASSDPKRRAELWSARKRAFGAIGRITPSYCTQDACVPRSKLPEVIAFIAQVSAKYNLRITNCFHAGDGNLHPAIMFDNANPDDIRRTLEAAHEILRYCISIGGVATGEHGVGIEKLPLLRDMFSPADLAAMHTVRRAFAPNDLMNPFKSLPRDGVEIDLLHPGWREVTLESVKIDLLGELHCDFEETGFVLVAQGYARMRLPAKCNGKSIVWNREMLYHNIEWVGVVRRKQWEMLVPGVIFVPLGLLWTVISIGQWGPLLFSLVVLTLLGILPLAVFLRGRGFLAIASRSEVIVLPLDKHKKALSRILGLLRQQVSSVVRWELDGTRFQNFQNLDSRPPTGKPFDVKRYAMISSLLGLFGLSNLLALWFPRDRCAASLLQIGVLLFALAWIIRRARRRSNWK